MLEFDRETTTLSLLSEAASEMTRTVKLAIVAAEILAMGAALLAFVPDMAPVKDGSARGFWLSACCVDINTKKLGFRGGTYPAQEGWLIYYVQTMHGRDLYRIRPDYSRPRDSSAEC